MLAASTPPATPRSPVLSSTRNVMVSGPPTTATLSVPMPAMMQAVGSSPSRGSAAATPSA